MLAIALQDDDAEVGLAAEFVHGLQHAANQARIVGIVDLRAVQRDRRDAAFIEVPQHWIGGHG